MNSEIIAYFNRIEQCLLESPAISDYIVIRCEVTPTDGKIRLRARLKDGGLLELFEYVVLLEGRGVVRRKYSYHWQGKDEHLVRRWDSVPHHPDLPYAPHHIHLADGGVEGVAEPPNAEEVLREIEETLEDKGLI